jgi:protein-disulfide isomerase
LNRIKAFFTHPLLTRYGWFYLAIVFTAVASFWGGTRYSGSTLLPSDQDTDHLRTEVPGWIGDVRTNNEEKSLGDPDAPVTVVEYMDVECPFCQRYTQTVFPKIVKNYVKPGKVHYRIHHFPLPKRIHPNAMTGAVAAECAARQEKFWEFKSLALSNRKELSAETFRTLAGIIEVPDLDRFQQCFRNRETADTVEEELRGGIDRGVEGTPTVFINGNSISGARSYSRYRNAIEQALEQES